MGRDLCYAGVVRPKIRPGAEVSLLPKSARSVVVEVVRRVQVAGGVFAPGHLGELTQVVPFEMVDAVLEADRDDRAAAAVAAVAGGVYFMLALGLFEQMGAALVWQKLVAGLAGLPVPAPSEKALRDLRRRIGAAPLRALFEVLAVPLARPSTPGVRYRRWRTVAFDGCASLRVPDREANRGWFGRLKVRFGVAGYPSLMLMTLAETGTRGLLGAIFGPSATGERAYAMRLAPLLGPDMLLLADRGLDGNDLLEAVTQTGAQFLVRGRTDRRPPVLARLRDGSYLTRIAGLKLRAIEADITVTGTDGTFVTSTYRLLTTLTDPHTDPAATLVALYHERWEIESAYYALRHTLLHGRVLRSKDPAGIEQEMWALLALYQALRHAMVTAVETMPGTDPDRASFTTALAAARDTVTAVVGVLPTSDTGRITTAVLTSLLPPRRPRFSARTVKSGISRYHTWNAGNRPLASTNIPNIAIIIGQGAPTQPHDDDTPATYPPGPTIVLAIMQATPEHSWRARDLARRSAARNPSTPSVPGWRNGPAKDSSPRPAPQPTRSHPRP
nr:IS4 family transposase [Nonomuraea sp. SYSU D8015]